MSAITEGRTYVSGVGTASAGLTVGGSNNYGSNYATAGYEWNGSSWSGSGALNTASYNPSCGGTQTSTIACGGQTGSYTDRVESYNGASWSEESPTFHNDLGWGNGIIKGLEQSTCEYVGWIHGDLQYDMKILIKVIELLQDPSNQHENILIKGRRAKRKFSENAFTMMMSIIASILLGKILYDINAQPNFFSRKILKNFKNTPKDLMLDLYLYNMMYRKKNKNIIRIPVVQKEREYGSSSWNRHFASKFFLGFKMLIGIIKII